MAQKPEWLSEYYWLGILIIIAAVALFLIIRGNPDVDFSRQLLNGLIEGRESIQDSIDWPSFKALDNDLGQEYLKLVNDNERRYFRKAFILNFSLSFKATGGRMQSFRNWRIYGKDNANIIVAANTLTNKIMFLTISKKHTGRKLLTIQYED